MPAFAIGETHFFGTQQQVGAAFRRLDLQLEMAIGEMRVISPLVSAWLPNLITGGIGWYILKRAADG